MTSSHVFSPYGNPGKEGCVRCPYPEGHAIHVQPSDTVTQGTIESRAVQGAVDRIRMAAAALESYGYSSPVAELRFIAAQVESGEHKF